MTDVPPQMLLDYDDLMKIPFYDILDRMLNEDGVKLRYICCPYAHTQKSKEFGFNLIIVFVFMMSPEFFGRKNDLISVYLLVS
jgi:hypothetical protein